MFFRLPYKWRRVEGHKSRFKLIRAFQYFCYLFEVFAENFFIKHCPLPKYGLNQTDSRKEKVIVSLTSFPARIDQVYFAIKSLMIQSYQADRIILWLSKQQFPNGLDSKPLETLQQKGLEMIFVDDDLRSHKKYFYALQQQKPDEVVITFDDDIIFEYDAIEKLIKTRQSYPDCIICNRGETIKIKDHRFEPYSKWCILSKEGVDYPSMMIVPSTGAGCLYPYGIMPPCTFDVSKIKTVAFSADDLWMRFNSMQKGIKIKKSQPTNAILCQVTNSQRVNLSQVNCIEGQNDVAIANLEKEFPKSISILLQE